MTPLKASDLDHSHYLRLRMTATVPPGTALEDVTNPGFWANHAYRLKPGAIIEVLAEDNSLDCELRVLETGPTFATVRVLRNYTEKASKPVARDLPDDVTISYGSKADKWRVVHQGKVVKDGIATEEAAQKAAEEYRSKFAA